MNGNFVHLHLHSEYSLLDASARIKDIVSKAKQLGMPAVALTDHGNLYGTIDFYKACVSQNIKPIIGCEAYITSGSRFNRKGSRSHIYHMTLLAKNNQGYKNLLKLISKAHLEGFYYKPRIDLELLKEHKAGLIGTSGCMNGEIPQKILEGDLKGAKKLAEELSRLFDPNCFYLEIQNHGLKEEKEIREVLADFAQSLGLPLVATNDVHYVEQEDAQFHDVLLCIGTASQIHDPKRKKYPCPEFYFKTPQQMAELFNEFPQAVENTANIARLCDVTIELGKNHFPSYTLPSPYKTHGEYLRTLCYEGLQKRYDNITEQIKERLEYELSVIEQTGFSSYFLIVWDFIHYAKKEGIPVGPGRGSAAGSLTAYVLGITDIDPIKYGLVFERFLNPQRVSPPDIDIDFCYNRRSQVIDYVRKKYGERSVAQIITFGTLGAKMAVRDVARVLGMSYQEADRIAKMIPPDPQLTLERARELNPQLDQLWENDPQSREVLTIATKLEGLTRQAGVHAAGVVISEGDLLDFIPLSRGEHNEIVTQWSMEPIAEIGLLKMDFLGLKTLTVISECLALIKEKENILLDPKQFPLDDKNTYELLGRGQTIGVFQLESSGMVELVKKLKPGNIEDIIALVALYRPGPMENIPAYADRKLGKVPITYDHPLLEPILKDTYGVMIYQEQVMQAANVLAGYSLGESDLLRRAMGKKKPEEMRKQRDQFIKGCKEKNNIPEEKAIQIFETLEKFAGYGFNKAHSACYGYLAYVTAYLKANYPVFYLCTLLSYESGDTEKIELLVSECRRMGIGVLPPDISKSEVRFSVEGGSIRWGLSAIKNVGEAAAEAIVESRKKRGSYHSLFDLCLRISGRTLNKKILESLIKSGACDSLGRSRKELLESLPSALSAGSITSKERLSGQQNLFEEHNFIDPTDRQSSAKGEDYPLNIRLQWEKELLGTYLSSHPLDEWMSWIRLFQNEPISSLKELADNSRLYVPGMITHIEKKTSQKSKKPYFKLILEDQTGHIEVILFKDNLSSSLIDHWTTTAFVVDGQLSCRENEVSIRSEHLYTIEEALQSLPTSLVITVKEGQGGADPWKKLYELFLENRGDIPVVFRYVKNEGIICSIEVGREFFVKLSIPFMEKLFSLFTPGSINLELKKPQYNSYSRRKNERSS